MRLEKLITYLFFSMTLLIGCTIFKDYGFGTDEHINRENGIVSLNYILNLLNERLSLAIWRSDLALIANTQELTQYKDRDYGVAFDLPAIVIERLLNLNSSRGQYLLRHGLTYFIFWVATIYFYKLIKLNFKDSGIALAAVAMLYLSPRIFADAFFNNKDIVFLSFFLIGTYYLVAFTYNSSKLNIVCFALFSGLAIDVRIIAVIFPILFLFILFLKVQTKEISIKRVIFYILLYVGLCSGCVLVFWPWLWADPLGNFLTAFQNMAKFRWLDWVLYRGHYYPSSSLPWHYLPIWILITTPPIYICLFLIGLARSLYLILEGNFRNFLTNHSMAIGIMVAICVSPIAAAILLKSTIYDGWRQFYFVYPSILFFSAGGISFLFDYLKKIRGGKLYFFAICLLIYGWIFNWMVKSHPYQNVYFNVLAGQNWHKQYESDYWGLSNLRGLQHILNESESDIVKVYGLGVTSIPQVFNLLPEQDKKRIEASQDIQTADYVLTNFRLLNNATNIAALRRLESEFQTDFSVIVDGKPILKVFRLRAP
jgi:hypothetical protein